jgi:aspartyl/asparaginyl beta-hydroxylase (cupin superfamily)
MVSYELKDADVNLSNKSCIDCQFEKGYTPCENNNTFNVNDKNGLILLCLFIIIILCFVFINKNRYIKYILLYSIYSFIHKIYTKPIVIIYVFSFIITMITRTPHYLNRNIYFTNHKKFENKHTFNKIKKEVMNIYKQRNKLALAKDTYGNDYIGGGNIKQTDGWRVYSVKLGDNYFASDTMPYLTKILKQIPEVKSCLISILPKKKAIPIHVGYTKGFLRYLLAMKVPKDRENVFMCANGEKYCWTEGEGLLFDDTYPHKVYNNTDEDRIVIYMDILRPFMNPILDNINKWFIKLATNTKMVKEEIAKTEKPIDIIK